MKKLLPLICLILLVASCKNDDDVTTPRCTEPTNIEASTISFDSATLTWTDENDTASFSIEYGLSGFMPGSGTVISSESTNLAISNLESNTNYDVYITSVCSASNESMLSDPLTFTTLPPPVIPQFLTNLSELNIYSGSLSELRPSIYTIEYDLASPLFSDYAHKQRLIALPPGTTMNYVDDGFPDFPDNTLISKTFFYNNNEQDLTQGKRIIETRILIKINGEWELGNYKWNAEMTEATLDTEGGLVPVTYVDENGETNNVNYQIPTAADCFTCHSISGEETPIGPRLRTLNFDGQLQDFIDNNYIDGIADATSVGSLPRWDDTSFTLEERARAYFDINCAHCHTEGGFCDTESDLRLRWETDFNASNIYEDRFLILGRMTTYIPGWSMPFIGTTMIHEEGFDLIEEYILSL